MSARAKPLNAGTRESLAEALKVWHGEYTYLDEALKKQDLIHCPHCGI